jgi:hypothetical protein
VWPEEELAQRLDAVRESPVFLGSEHETAIDVMLEQMGEEGQKYLSSSARQRQKRK